MARFRTFDDLDVRNKTVLLRADLNVAVKALGAGRPGRPPRAG
jgi:3-phosphoglycerate kinase